MEYIGYLITLVVGVLGGGYGGHKLGRRAEAKARELIAQGQAIAKKI